MNTVHADRPASPADGVCVYYSCGAAAKPKAKAAISGAERYAWSCAMIRWGADTTFQMKS